MASDSINIAAVVLEVQSAECSDLEMLIHVSINQYVLSSFFQSILLSLKSHQDIRFKNILGSFEFFTFNSVSQLLKFSSQDVQNIVSLYNYPSSILSYMAGRSSDAQTEKPRVRESEVQAGGSIDEAVLVQEVLGGSSPHALSGPAS